MTPLPISQQQSTIIKMLQKRHARLSTWEFFQGNTNLNAAHNLNASNWNCKWCCSQPFAHCTLNRKTIAVGFKLALTVLLVAIVSATELTATSSRYSATGLSFVVYVMGGNDIGTSFTKSYNRMLGLVCGVCLPTMVEDWIGCESNVLTILFVYFYVWGCGTVYAGAIPQFSCEWALLVPIGTRDNGAADAGLVCGYVTIVEMSYQNCDSATTLDSLNASFIAMVFLIVVEMNVMHTSAKTEFTESMSKFWNAFGADERGLVNNIFYLWARPTLSVPYSVILCCRYIAKHDITLPDQKISNTATRATIAAGINDCLTYLAEARVFLQLVEQEPQFASPLPPGYRAYLDGADSLMGAIRGINTTMSRYHTVIHVTVTSCSEWQIRWSHEFYQTAYW